MQIFMGVLYGLPLTRSSLQDTLRPCRMEDMNGNVVHTENCAEGHQCLLELRDVIVNDTFRHLTFCAYPAEIYVSNQ